jgi:hypothetical protein
MGSAAWFTLASSASAALQSGIYQTMPGATLLEQGDNVPNGSRIVPLTAALTFDLAGAISGITLVPEPGTLALISAGAGVFWALRLSRKAHNERAGGDGGTALLRRAGRPCPAAPHHERSATN